MARGFFQKQTPGKIHERSFTVDDKTIRGNFSVIFSPDDLIETIEKYFNSGATHAELVTHCFPEKIRSIGEKVLPYFKEKRQD